MLFTVLTLTANSKKKDLVTVNMVNPKNGQKMVFEAAYKVLIANKKPVIAFKVRTGFYVQNNMPGFIVHTYIATTRMTASAVAFNKAG